MAPQQQEIEAGPVARPADQRPLFMDREGSLRPVWAVPLFLVLLAGTIAVQVAVVSRVAGLHPEPHSTLTPRDSISDAVIAVALLVSTWVMAKAERRSLGAYGFRALHPVRHLLGGALTGIALLSALVLLLHQLNLVVFRGQVLFGADAEWKLTFEWAGFYVLAAFAEEFLVRGYLQYGLTRGIASALQRRFAPARRTAAAFWFSAVLLSTLWVVLQQWRGATLLGLLNAGLLGLLMAFSLWRTGSLWWAFGYHAAWDWAQSFLWGVPNAGVRARDHLFLTEATGSTLRSGGSVGPEGSIYTLGALAAGFGILMLLRPRRVYPELWDQTDRH